MSHISQFFVLNSFGHIVLHKQLRDNLSKSTTYDFYHHYHQNVAIFVHDEVNYIYLEHNGLYFVCTSIHNICGSQVLEFLFRLKSIFQDHCGSVLNQKTIRSNCIALYQILDDVVQNGYIHNVPNITPKIIESYNGNTGNIVLNRNAISAQINQRYATINYLLDFHNTAFCSKELNFQLTIHSDAFISKFVAEVDGEIFYGKTKEKNTANIEYEQAKYQQNNAILITKPFEDISNVFQIKTNINGNSKISLNIAIEQYIKKQFNFNTLNIELLNEFEEYNVSSNFVSIPFEICVSDKSGIYDVKLSEESGLIVDNKEMDELNQTYLINGRILSTLSANEISFSYKLKGEQQHSYTIYDHNKTFVHVISNVDISFDEQCEGKMDAVNVVIPRRIVFALDRSGSMKDKWEKTISSTIIALNHLRKWDRFNIVFFNHYNTKFNSNGLLSANEKNISKAIIYLKEIYPSGNTDINDALLESMRLIQTDIDAEMDDIMVNQLIFITDGFANHGVTDANQILSNIITTNKYQSQKINISCFGIGNDSNNPSQWTMDLNHNLLKLLARNTNGMYKRIKQSNTAKNLDQYYNILSNPILSNISLKYPSEIKHLTPTTFDTMYAGTDLIICGQIDDTIYNVNESMHVKLSAMTARIINNQNNDPIIKPVTIETTIEINLNDGYHHKGNKIQRTWAYLKLKQFETESLIHAEQQTSQTSLSPLALALEYSFVTPWTSMIVVQQKKDKYPIKLTEYSISSSSSNRNVKKAQRSIEISGKFQSKSSKTKSSDAICRPIAYSRDRRRKKARNEIFVDVVETITASFKSNGNIGTAVIDGEIKMKSYVQENPVLKLGFNEHLVIHDAMDRNNVDKSGVVLDGCNFHECVDLMRYPEEREIIFKPPDAEFILMKYRTTANCATLPFTVYHSLKVLSLCKIELIIKIRANFSEYNYAGNTVIECKTPCNIFGRNVNTESGRNFVGQTSEYDEINHRVIWKMKKVTGQTERCLRILFVFDKEQTDMIQHQFGPISMQFEMPMYNNSGLQIRYLRIESDKNKRYNPYRWVRYITRSTSYTCRL